MQELHMASVWVYRVHKRTMFRLGWWRRRAWEPPGVCGSGATQLVGS
jgi:hypothetical protein